MNVAAETAALRPRRHESGNARREYKINEMLIWWRPSPQLHICGDRWKRVGNAAVSVSAAFSAADAQAVPLDQAELSSRRQGETAMR